MPDLSHHPYAFVWLGAAWLYWFGLAIAMGVKLLRLHPVTLRSWLARGMIGVELAAALIGFYLVLALSIRTPTAVDETLTVWSLGGGALGVAYVAFLYRMENERRRARGTPVLKSFFGR
jgi:hypothetical protein